MEFEPIKKDVLEKRKKERTLIFVFAFFMIGVLGAISYSFFNYTRTGENNTIKTGNIEFEFNDNNPSINIGNAFPVDDSEVDNTYEGSFTITAHTSLPDGIRYRVYAIYGDDVTSKTRLLDNVITFQFTSATDGDGFTTSTNSYSTAGSLVFENGKALISTGLVKNTSDLTTKTYNYKLWIDSSKILISSTTKRATNAEGNPSLADTTTGNVTASRYIKNDSNLVETTLFPAFSEHAGKIVYTTNEFKNSYYSIKIVVEAEGE